MRAAEFDRLYESASDGYGGVKLTLRQPTQTFDSASDFRGRGDAGRNLFGRERRTHDDVLTGPEPVTRISLGKIWAGGDDDPLVTAANYATQAFAEGCFAPDQPLHAESLENVISRGKVWIGALEAVQAKLANADSAYGARAAKDTSGHGPAGDLPPTTDSASVTRGRSALFSSRATQNFAATLKKGREAQAPTAPAKVMGARDYAANLAAHRAKTLRGS